MNANNRKIETEASGGTNYYTTGATLGGDNILTGSTQATTWTANLSALVDSSPLTTKGDIYVFGSSNTRLPVGANGKVLKADSSTTTGLVWGDDNSTPGGSDTQIQYNNGGAFGGADDLVWDGSKLKLGDSTDTGNYFEVEGSDSENTYDVLVGRRRYPRISLNDRGSYTMQLWALGGELRFGTAAGSNTTAAFVVRSGSVGSVATAGAYTYGLLSVGASTTINSSKVSIVDTTRPLVLGYDGSNYVNFEVSNSGDLTIDSADDIRLDAGGQDIVLKGNGSEFGRLTNSSQDFIIQNTQNDKDIIFKTVDNTTATEVMRIDGSESRVGIGIDAPTSKLHVKGTLDIQSGNQTILMGAGNSSTARNDNSLKLARVGLAHYHNSEEAVAMLYAASNGTDNTVVMGGGTSGMNAATRLQFATAENDATTAGTVRASIQGDSNYDKLFLGADTTLGFYRYSNRMDFYISSNPRMHLDASKLYSATSGGPLLDLTPTTNEANYGFVDDPDTGMSRTAANTLAFLAAGAEQLVITDNLLTLGDGVVLAPHSSDDFTIDSPNDIVLDADGGDVLLKDGSDGTFGKLTHNNTYWDFNGNTGDSYLRFIPWNGGAGTTAYTYWGDGTHNQVIYLRGTDSINTNSITLANTYIQLYDGAGNSDTFIQAGGDSYFRNDLGIGTTSPNAPLDVYNTATQQRWSYNGSYYADMTVESDGDTTLYARQGALNLKAPGAKTIRLDSSGDVMLDLGGSAGTYLMKVVDSSANWLFTVHDDGLAGLHGSDSALEIKERAAAPNHTAAYGKLWVKNDDPANLYYTDDGGNDIALTNNGSAAGGGTIGGSVSDNNIPIGTAADTLGDFSPAYSEGQNIIIGRTQRNTTTDADDNTIFGYNAGYELTTGDRNVLVGRNAGDSLTTATSNVAIGRYAMSDATTESYMIAIGTSAGTASTDGSVSVGHTAGAAAGAKKVAIGYQALLYPSGANNTAVGYKALIGASSGDVGGYSNTAVGREAGMSMTTGYQNVLIGNQAGDAITTAARNVIIGSQAVEGSNTDESVIIGAYAGFATTTAIDSSVIIGTYAAQNGSPSNAVILGRQAGYYASGAGNVYMGYQSGFGNATTNNGTYNTAVGYEAMEKVEDATENVAIGSQALQYNTSGDYNTALGTNALYVSTTASKNVAIGRRSMFTSTTATQNVSIGYHSLYDLTDGNDNVAVGYLAAENLNTGVKNVVIGASALAAGTTTHSNVAIGYQALDSTTVGSENVAVGAYAGQALVGTTSSVYGGFSTFIGHTAGYQITGNVSYGGNTMVGHAAGYSATGADRSTGLGASALYYADGAKYNTAVGRVAGAYAKGTGSTHVGDSSGYRISGNYNTSVGFAALSGASSGTGYGTAQQNVAIGREAMLDATSAQENVVIGNYAAAEITGGDYNVAIGHAALRYGTTTNRQVAVGYAALSNFTQDGDLRNTAVGMYAMLYPRSGSNNIAMGYGAMRGANSTYDSDYNVALGSDTLYSIEGGNSNTAVGYQAGYNVTTGGDNVLVGRQAGNAITTSNSSTLVGYKAGFVNTAASTVALGKNAGYSNSSGGNNTFIGFSAGHSNDTGASNVFLGYQAGYPINENRNVVIGTNAGVAADAGTNDSVLIGNEAGYSTAGNQIAIGRKSLYYPHGNYNVAIGQESMHGASSVTTAEHNIAIGRKALFSATSAPYNVVVGYQAGYGLTTGGYSTLLGYEAGYTLSTTNHNIAIGYQAMKFATSAEQNTAIGYHALGEGTLTGDENVAIGQQSLADATSANKNVAVGQKTGEKVTTGTENVIMGWEAGAALTTGSYNIFVGSQAGKLSTTGNYNTTLGYQSLYNNVHGDRNTAIGYQALHLSTPSDGGGQNTAVGDRAGYKTNTGHSNVYVGALAGYELTTGERNVIMGHEAAKNANTMNYSTVIGNNAGTMLSGSESVVIIGRNAGYYVSGSYNTFVGTNASLGGASLGHDGRDSVAIGYNAMYYNSTASYNTAVGTSALQGASAGLTGDNNVAVGRQAMFSASSAGSNVVVGYHAGYNQTTGDDNVFIGTSAGKASTTAAGNVAIGKDAMKVGAQTSSSGGQNSVVGYGAYVDGTGQRNAILGYRAAYTSTSANMNVAIGYEAGQKNTTGDSNVFIGNKAGPSSTSTASNELYIHNDEGTPLIKGDFSAGTVTINGTISATAKSFNIEHPLYKDKRLVHGSLEGPEHGIYIRGTIEAIEGCEIELPEYWSAMCEDYTVQLTPHGPYTVYIKEKLKDKVMVECSQEDFKFDYYIVGARTDETLEVVQDG